METNQSEMMKIKVILDADQWNFIQENNIDLNEFVRSEIKKLMEESKNK